MSPIIPANPDELSTTFEVMDETLTYEGIIKKCHMAQDKNQTPYLAIDEIEVIMPPEWMGKRVSDNYIRIPGVITPDMTIAQRRQVKDDGVKLGRICAAFKPPIPLSTETLVGCQGKFTVKNDPCTLR